METFEPDPLYGEELDDEDENWIRVNSGGISDLPSDATLSCPACFTTLCLCSQRHEQYKEQYRALFVMNCLVQKKTDFASLKEEDERRSDGGRERTPEEDGYLPVLCGMCRTQVAYYDSDEIFHFYNVLPSAGNN
jgi:hypothetical protein